MRIVKVLVLIVSIFGTMSCSGDTAIVKGKFAGVKNKKIIIEEITPNAVSVIDSIHTSDSGEFKFKFTFDDNMPVFLRIRHKNDFINIIVNHGETIEINSLLNLSENYVVTGSHDSQLIKELNSKLSNSYRDIKTLTDEYSNTSDYDKKDKISTKIGRLYITQKQENIKFIMLNSKSLSSIISLYQVFPNGVSIFGETADLQYFKLVADSLEDIYSNSSFVIGLKNTIKQQENRQNINDIISEAVINKIESSYPEIELPDPTGEMRKLSDLNGKVIMLVIWSPEQESAKFLNNDLKELYSVYADRGLEIYQVTLEENMLKWITLVKNQQLPWINVNDNKGLKSNIIKTFNIQSLPSNYIIDRNGNIVGKSLWHTDLINKLNDIL